MITAEGGLYSYLGTYSAYEVDEKVTNGDEEAKFYFDAMAYQVSKSIASMFAVLKGEVDAILISGPLAQSQNFVNQINERISKSIYCEVSRQHNQKPYTFSTSAAPLP